MKENYNAEKTDYTKPTLLDLGAVGLARGATCYGGSGESENCITGTGAEEECTCGAAAAYGGSCCSGDGEAY